MHPSRNSICFLLLLLSIQFTMIKGQASLKQYLITGEIKGLPNKVPIFLIRIGNGDTIARVLSDSGKFRIEGNYEEEGEMHFVKFDSSGLYLPRRKQTWIRLYFEDKPIVINSTLSEWPSASISGSPSTEVYDEIYNRISVFVNDYKKRVISIGQDSSALSELIREISSKQLKVYLDYPDTWAAADLARATNSFGFIELKTAYEGLTSRVQRSFAGRMLKRRLDLRSPESAIKQGNIVPNFTVQNILGTNTNIHDLIKNSKYTLIDFWASWCRPCIETIPTLKALVASYNNRDFQIVGISIDKNREDWINSLSKNSATWVHGIDQRGRTVKEIFGMLSIPAYLLVDSTGKMTAYTCTVGEVKSFGSVLNDSTSLHSVLSSLLEGK